MNKLLGRSAELERIRVFLAAAAGDGAARLVSGDPGVGKSTLLNVAAEMANAAGFGVLRVDGVEFEADVSCSGLNQALRNATLSLLKLVAADRPLLLIVDDLHWLDRASAVVLGFVARRLAGSHIGFVAASRSGAETFFDRGELSEHVVHPLDEIASAALA